MRSTPQTSASESPTTATPGRDRAGSYGSVAATGGSELGQVILMRESVSDFLPTARTVENRLTSRSPSTVASVTVAPACCQLWPESYDRLRAITVPPVSVGFANNQNNSRSTGVLTSSKSYPLSRPRSLTTVGSDHVAPPVTERVDQIAFITLGLPLAKTPPRNDTTIAESFRAPTVTSEGKGPCVGIQLMRQFVESRRR